MIQAPPDDGVVLGRSVESGALVRLPYAFRQQHVYCLGANGTGKSTLALSLMAADMRRHPKTGFLLLDPARDLADDVRAVVPRERAKDVMVFDVLDPDRVPGLNLFWCADPRNSRARTDSLNLVLHVIDKLWGPLREAPQLSMVLRHLTMMMIETSGTIVEAYRVLVDPSYRREVTRTLAHSTTRLVWDRLNRLSDDRFEERTNSTLNKLDAFLADDYIAHIVAQEAAIDFRAIIDAGKIVLVKLSDKHEELTSLVGSLMVSQLLAAAQSRKDLARDARSLYMLYADEFDYFVTPDFATFLKGTRKYGIGAFVAHQTRAKLSRELAEATLQVGSVISFRSIADPDAKVIADEYDNTKFPGEPKQQMVTQPIIRTYTEVLWDPPEAEQQFKMAWAELSAATDELGQLHKIPTKSQEEWLQAIYRETKPVLQGTKTILRVFERLCEPGHAVPDRDWLDPPKWTWNDFINGESLPPRADTWPHDYKHFGRYRDLSRNQRPVFRPRYSTLSNVAVPELVFPYLEGQSLEKQKEQYAQGWALVEHIRASPPVFYPWGDAPKDVAIELKADDRNDTPPSISRWHTYQLTWGFLWANRGYQTMAHAFKFDRDNESHTSFLAGLYRGYLGWPITDAHRALATYCYELEQWARTDAEQRLTNRIDQLRQLCQRLESARTERVIEVDTGEREPVFAERYRSGIVMGREVDVPAENYLYEIVPTFLPTEQGAAKRANIIATLPDRSAMVLLKDGLSRSEYLIETQRPPEPTGVVVPDNRPYTEAREIIAAGIERRLFGEPPQGGRPAGPRPRWS